MFCLYFVALLEIGRGASVAELVVPLLAEQKVKISKHLCANKYFPFAKIA